MSIVAPSYTHHQKRQQYHHKQTLLGCRNSYRRCYSWNLTAEASNDYDGGTRSVKNAIIFDGQYLDNQNQKRQTRRHKYSQKITNIIYKV